MLYWASLLAQLSGCARHGSFRRMFSSDMEGSPPDSNPKTKSTADLSAHRVGKGLSRKHKVPNS